jgi:hypothetical protein
MALKPFERRVGSPRAVPLTPVRQVNIPDIGPQIQQAANVLASYGIEGMEKESRERAVTDVAAAQFARDENGNLVMPDIPEAGDTYKQAYTVGITDRYIAETTSDVETRLNKIYFDPENLGKAPEQLYDEAKLMVDAVINNAHAFAKTEVAKNALRELNQRNLRAVGEHRRRQEQLMSNAYADGIERFSEDAFALSFLPGEEATAAFEGNKIKAVESAQKLVDLNLKDQGFVSEVAETFESIRSAGQFYQEINAKLTSGEFDSTNLISAINILTANDTQSTILGKGYADFIESIGSKERTMLVRKLNNRVQQLKAQEDDLAEQTEEIAAGATFNTSGFIPSGTSEGTVETLTDNFLRSRGYNPETPDKESVALLLTHFEKIGQIPKKYFEPLQNIESASLEQVQAALPIYEALRSPLTDEGEIGASLAHEFMSTREIAFMENVIIASTFGDPEPVTKARAAVDAMDGNLNTEAKARTYLHNSGGGKKVIDETFTEAFEKYNVNVSAIQQNDNEDLLIYVSQLHSTGVPISRAVELGVSRFVGTRKLVNSQTYGPLLGTGDDGSFYARPEEVIEDVRVIKNNTVVSGTANVIEAYTNLALNEADLPVSRDSYKVGENTFVKAIPDSNGLFFVMSDSDEEGVNIVRDVNNMPVMLNLALAAQRQNASADMYESERNRAADRLATLRKAAYPMVQGTMSFQGATFAAPKRGRGSPEAISAYEQARKEFNEMYGSSGERVVSPDPLTGATNIVRVGQTRLAIKPDKTDIEIPRRRREILEGARNQGSEQQLVKDMAAALGVEDYELAAVLMLESGDTMSPSIVGGKNNDYVGIYQMSSTVRAAFGVDRNSSFAEQLATLPLYLEGKGKDLGDTGYRPGMGVQKLYRAINGGNINSNAADRGGRYGPMEAKFALIRRRYDAAKAWLRGN